jgi:2-keto-3-deoxy-L-rhamnonate aldolase RhmA
MPSVITANRLVDGIVVYLSEDDKWLTELAAARVADDEAGLEKLTAIAGQAAADHIIVGPYSMAVDLSEGVPGPKSVREQIRAAHRPTITAVTEAR